MRKTKSKHLPPAEVEEIARVAMRKALIQVAAENEDIPREFWRRLALGVIPEKGHCGFELYLAQRRPQDALIVSRATVDTLTGEVSVEVFVDALTEAVTRPHETGSGIDF